MIKNHNSKIKKHARYAAGIRNAGNFPIYIMPE
jgi:hypothetical protein